jgi:hypothetical protein
MLAKPLQNVLAKYDNFFEEKKTQNMPASCKILGNFITFIVKMWRFFWEFFFPKESFLGRVAWDIKKKKIKNG